jgi:hypothetical protein
VQVAGAGVRKPPMEETAGRKGRCLVRRDLWAFEDRGWLACIVEMSILHEGYPANIGPIGASRAEGRAEGDLRPTSFWRQSARAVGKIMDVPTDQLTWRIAIEY